jgi:hypothetical protein
MEVWLKRLSAFFASVEALTPISQEKKKRKERTCTTVELFTCSRFPEDPPGLSSCSFAHLDAGTRGAAPGCLALALPLNIQQTVPTFPFFLLNDVSLCGYAIYICV